MNDQHTVMPRKLAQALIEAGMKHYAAGGMTQPGAPAPANPQVNPLAGAFGDITGNGGGAPAQAPAASAPGLGPKRGTGYSLGQMTSPAVPGQGGYAGGGTGAYNTNSGGGGGGGDGGLFGGVTSGLSGLTGGVLGGSGGLMGLLGMNNNINAKIPNLPMQNYMPRIAYAQDQQDINHRAQMGLANRLLDQADGNGPSYAQDMLANQTGRNVATQGALMASARGANRNPALVAKQAAMQGGALQQQAVGQAATMRDQEYLGALNAYGNELGQIGQQQLASEQINQGGFNAQNANIMAGVTGANQINANAAMANQGAFGNLLGAGMMGVGAYLALASKGGKVEKGKVKPPGYAEGGYASMPMPQIQPYQGQSQSLTGPLKDLLMAVAMNGGGGENADAMGGGNAGYTVGGGPHPNVPMMASGGQYMPMVQGGGVPGQAKIAGDSKQNDTVPALLSPGEIVLPRSVTQGGNVEAKAIEFLRSLKGKKASKYGDVIEARKACGGRV